MRYLIAHCSIEVQAYGANNDATTKHGFVNLNAVPVWQSSWHGTYPNLRGVTVILVDAFNCSAHESRRFDTFGDANAATALTDYLQQVSRYYIIVGVTADEATLRLASALPTLREMGADVTDVQYRGSVAFAAQKGFPAKTVLRKALTQADSSENQPQFKAYVTGSIYLACADTLNDAVRRFSVLRSHMYLKMMMMKTSSKYNHFCLTILLFLESYI